MRILSPVFWREFVYAHISAEGSQFFPRTFLHEEKFCLGLELVSEGSKAYATQIGWFNYSMSYGCWD